MSNEPYNTPDERVWGDHPAPMGTPELNQRLTSLRANRDDYADAMIQTRHRGIIRWIQDKWNEAWTR